MAHSLSAKKRIRQNEKRRLRNNVRKNRLKNAVRSFESALETKDQARIQDELNKVQKAFDKAKNHGILHRNNVDRQKGRMCRMARQTSAPNATS